MLKRWMGVLYFISNAVAYTHRYSGKTFRINFRNIYYRTYERFSPAGSVPDHYFLQDIWAARYIHEQNIKKVVDVGSRFDGFIAHILPYCRVTFVDIRPLDILVENLEFLKGNITALPFENESVPYLSTLHVIEHIGLGRYGDPIDPIGHIKAAKEIHRILQPGGTLILSTVLGSEKLCFDGHRIFNPKTVLSMFNCLTLEKFCLIDDEGKEVIEDASFDMASACKYGCGIFIFKKPNRGE